MTDEMIQLKVTAVVQETPQMRMFRLGKHKPWGFIPGQIAILSLDGKARSYSAPEDEGGMEFLIGDSTGPSHAFYGLPRGSNVLVKRPAGKGFSIDNFKKRDILMTAVGSAISPVRSVLQSACHRRPDFGKFTLVFGFRNPADIPFRKGQLLAGFQFVRRGESRFSVYLLQCDNFGKMQVVSAG